MYWQNRFERENPDEKLEKEILDIRKVHKDYGYRRIWGELRNRNIFVNKKKVQRIVQKLNLQVTSFTHKSRKYSSYKGKVGKIAPNRINRRFNTSVPHQKITTDTSEFKYYEVDSKGRMIIKKLYFDPFMDMFNGEILSFGISQKPSAENIMSALDKAITITNDCSCRRTFHSDRGWAYQMKAYSQKLKENNPRFPKNELPAFDISPMTIPNKHPIPAHIFRSNVHKITEHILQSQIVPNIAMKYKRNI